MSANTWPDGHRHAMCQDEHERWNTRNYPGTRQLCCRCDGETDRCEEDEITLESGEGPLCVDCWHSTDEYRQHQDDQVRP